MTAFTRKLAQRWHFGHSVPLRQLLVRVWRTVQRRLESRWPPRRRASGTHHLRVDLPKPVFAPRAIPAKRDGADWEFGFLARMVRMEGGISWHTPAFDPAEQLWRMNLHYMEWLETLDAEEGLAAILSWIEANPPYARASWADSWNSYTLSLRVICWMQFLARHHLVPPPQVADSLAEQLDFLTRHLESDLGGNHLMKNIKALLWGSAALSGPKVARWQRLGMKLLTREVAQQVLPDGLHYELSPSYHAQVFADLIECHVALEHAQEPSPLGPVLARMADASIKLRHPDGGPAQFNDAGLTMCYAPDACRSAYLAATGAAAPVAPQGPFMLPNGGYAGHFDPHFYLVVDFGLVGPPTLPAHAHGDIGSFELSVGGVRMIVDQGVFEYVDGPKRRLSRATRAHNTLAIGDHDQADFFGAFRAGKRPRKPWMTRDLINGVSGTYAPAHDLPHRADRRFEMTDAGFTLTDRLDRPAADTVTQNFLLHPACTVKLDGTIATITRDGHDLVMEAAHAFTASPAVWWPDMGQEVETQRLSLTFPPDCTESAIAFRMNPPAPTGKQ